jgi:hypothetical protein
MNSLDLYYWPYFNFGDRLNFYVFQKIFKKKIVYTKMNFCQALGIGSLINHLFVNKKELEYIPTKSAPIKVFSSGIVWQFLPTQLDQILLLRKFDDNLILRGKNTYELLKKICELEIKKITFGDGGLLVGFNEKPKFKRKKILFFPHYLDKYDNELISKIKKIYNQIEVINIFTNDEIIINKIKEADFVISTALHPLVVADSLGTANLWLVTENRLKGRDEFKFYDYYSVYCNYKKEPVSVNFLESKELWQLLEKEKTNLKRAKDEINQKQVELYKAFLDNLKDLEEKKIFYISQKEKSTKTVAVYEFNNCHGELLPSIEYYFKKLGYRVKFYINAGIEKDNPFLDKLDTLDYEIINETDLKDNFDLDKNTNLKEEFDFIFINSTKTYLKEINSEYFSTFYLFMNKKIKTKYGFIALAHNAMDLDYIERELIKQKRLLKLHPIFNYELNKRFTLYPIVFPAIKDEVFTKQENKISFLHIGRIDSAFRDIDLLFKAIEKIEKKDLIRFNLIGKNNLNCPTQYKKLFSELGYLDFQKMYYEIKKSDFLILPISVKNLTYFSNSYSGLIPLSIGFEVPIITHRDVGSLFYDDSFTELFYRNEADLSNIFQKIIDLKKRNKLEDYLNFFKRKIRKLKQNYINQSLENLGFIIEDSIKKSDFEREKELFELEEIIKIQKQKDIENRYLTLKKEYKVLEEKYKNITSTKIYRFSRIYYNFKDDVKKLIKKNKVKS